MYAVADERWRSLLGTPPTTPDDTEATSGDFKDAAAHSWDSLCWSGTLRCRAAAPGDGCAAGSKHGCIAHKDTKGEKDKRWQIGYEMWSHIERNSKRIRKMDSMLYLNLLLGCFAFIVLFWWRQSSSVSGIELFQIQFGVFFSIFRYFFFFLFFLLFCSFDYPVLLASLTWQLLFFSTVTTILGQALGLKMTWLLWERGRKNQSKRMKGYVVTYDEE